MYVLPYLWVCTEFKERIQWKVFMWLWRIKTIKKTEADIDEIGEMTITFKTASEAGNNCDWDKDIHHVV